MWQWTGQILPEYLYKNVHVKQCVWFLIVYMWFFMYKSKEYNGMDILDSIFSDQRQKDVMNEVIEYLFNDSETHE